MGKVITDYHIESLARFVEPGHIVILLPDKSETAYDPFAWAAYQTFEILKASGDVMAASLISPSCKTRSISARKAKIWS